jgi:hypothetical protein
MCTKWPTSRIQNDDDGMMAMEMVLFSMITDDQSRLNPCEQVASLS